MPLDSSVTFEPGETAKTVRVPIRDDADQELDEVVYVWINVLTGSVIVANSRGEIRIAASDGRPGVPVASISDVIVDEAQGTARFAVTLSRPSSNTVSLNYATKNGTAIAGEDYVATSGALSFAPNEAVKIVTVKISNDSCIEGTRTSVSSCPRS